LHDLELPCSIVQLEKTNFILKKTNFRNFGICGPSKQKIFWVFNYVQFDLIIFFKKYVNLYVLRLCETKMLIAVEITRNLQNIRLSIETGEFCFSSQSFSPKIKDNRFIHLIIEDGLYISPWVVVYVLRERTNDTMSQLFFSCNENENCVSFFLFFI
jgi:hypothetical protein